MKSKFYFVLVFIAFFTLNASYATDTSQVHQVKHVNSGFIDFNGYYDTRNFSVLTLNMLAKLPHRFQYFSLTNFQGPSKSSDLSRYYSEQNLRWAIKNTPFDLTMQWVLKSGESNDNLRFGARWRLSDTPKLGKVFKKINMFYSVNPYVIQFAENKQTQYFTQIEHIYKINLLPKILKGRVYIGGFADQNLIRTDNKLSVKWVTEHQLGLRLIDQLFVIAEYRINDYLPTDNYGLGYGVEYKIKF